MRWQVSTGLVVLAAAAGLIAGNAMRGVGPTAAEAETKPVSTPLPSPVVVVVDHTQGTWGGVQDAIDGWSHSPLVQLQRAQRCDPERFCIVLEQPMRYQRDWIGWRTPVTRQVSYIQLNAGDTRARHQRVRSWIVCHEIGHSLGLLHPDSNLGRGCMVDDVRSPARPTGFDLRMLAEVKRNGPPEGTALLFIYAEHDRS